MPGLRSSQLASIRTTRIPYANRDQWNDRDLFCLRALPGVHEGAVVKKLIKEMTWFPFGFPLGWIASRISDGRYDIAALDLVGCVVIVGIMYLVGRLT